MQSLQKAIGNRALTGSISDSLPLPHPLQRQIGDGQPTGQKVQKQGLVPWEITKAVNEDGRWKYTISLRGLLTKDVYGDDPEWDLVVEDDDPVAAEVRGIVDPAKLPAINGNLREDWLAAEEGDDAISDCVLMSQYKEATDSMKYLWSGGAADCIIVAGCSGEKAFLTHADRSSGGSVADQASAIGGPVYLSSQLFKANGFEDSDLVQTIVLGLREQGVPIAGVFTSGKLAINAATGDVLSAFENPKETKDPSAERDDSDDGNGSN